MCAGYLSSSDIGISDLERVASLEDVPEINDEETATLVELDIGVEILNDFVEKEKQKKKRGATTGSGCDIPVIRRFVRRFRVHRARGDKLRTLRSAKHQKIEVFEYQKQCLTSSRPATGRNVYVGRILDSTADGQRVAVKKIPCETKLHLESLLREVTILRQIDGHPHNSVQTFLDHAIDEKSLTIYIVTTLYDCSLADVFQSRCTTDGGADVNVEDELSPTGWTINWAVYRRLRADRSAD